jgi:CubicO group peptidase (beta-lactamase class C family)
MNRTASRAGVDDARRVLEEARAARVFPAAVAEVGDGAGAIWADAVGTRTFDDLGPIDLDTPFDLASLTKVICTTTVLMQQVERGLVSLAGRNADLFPDWQGADREDVTVRDLLEHASGLAARLIDAPPAGRREFEHDICTMPLEYTPRTRSIYSDLGFILLGLLVTDRGGATLARQFASLWGDERLAYELPADDRRRAAPTLPMKADPRRGRLLIGEVHDDYAAILGETAGHAGLFGSAPAVGAFARTVLRAARGDRSGPAPFSPERVRELTTKSCVPGSSRALGWDTMLPTSSCGTRMTPAAFGHVGYTGTSLWIDPGRDRYFVLLTNRACGGGTIEQMRDVRRAFHDILGDR